MASKSRQPSVEMRLVPALMVCFFLAGQLPAAAAAPAGKRAPDLVFERQVKPILNANCVRCHGGRQTKGKLDLSTRDNLLLGGKSGPSVVPGKPKDSLLLEVVVPGGAPHMPPKKQLGRAELVILTKWITTLKAGDVAAVAKRKDAGKKRRKRDDDDDDDDDD